jgi:uncharacterized phage protein (TIGR01671 family)
MSRPIKFRVYNRIDNTMKEVVEVNFKTGSINSRFNANNVLLEFTGCKDRKDKELYEGDITTFIGTGDNNLEPIRKGVIVFDRGCFYILNMRSAFKLTAVLDLEVIGNVHQNPELLDESL